MSDKERALKLMRDCWELSEQTGDDKLKRLAEAAGNCLENSFCSGEPFELALAAITYEQED